VYFTFFLIIIISFSSLFLIFPFPEEPHHYNFFLFCSLPLATDLKFTFFLPSEYFLRLYIFQKISLSLSVCNEELIYIFWNMINFSIILVGRPYNLTRIKYQFLWIFIYFYLGLIICYMTVIRQNWSHLQIPTDSEQGRIQKFFEGGV